MESLLYPQVCVEIKQDNLRYPYRYFSPPLTYLWPNTDTSRGQVTREEGRGGGTGGRGGEEKDRGDRAKPLPLAPPPTPTPTIELGHLDWIRHVFSPKFGRDPSTPSLPTLPPPPLDNGLAHSRTAVPPHIMDKTYTVG